MPKFNFNDSKYAGFWGSRDAANALRIFVNDPDIILQKDTFWRKNFSVDPMLTTRNHDGVANFSAYERRRSVANMADMRAPLAETRARDKQGIDVYTGPIPDFATAGYVETAMEREARERMFEEYFGNDAELLAAYADEIQVMADEMNQTMSNLGAQLITKGSIQYNHGLGIHGNIYKAPIPVENFVKAGALVWSDPNAKILDYMAEIEQDFRDRTAYAGALKWQLPLALFRNVVLKNAQVKEYVLSWRTLNEKPVVAGMSINEEMFKEAFSEASMISPIEIVYEGQKDGAKGAVHGWKDGIAVLRPVGFAGELKRAGILDVTMAKKYGSSVINTVFTQLDIFTIVNTTLNNGRYKEWHTDLLLSAVPTLDEFNEHIIVDTTVANA